MKTLFTFIASLFIATAARADHWTIERMNEVVDQTNMIVGDPANCSGTLISLRYRLVLTNHHCITGQIRHRTKEKVVNGEIKKVKVEELLDMTVAQKSYADFREVGRSSWKAVIVAKWKESDLALLQIRAEKIPHSYQSNIFAGKKVMRGETVYAVGNPRLLDATISKGIISSINRLIRVPWADNAEVAFIQMDAPISGGSSGGALYNAHGYLIGVPAAGTRDGAIGLAIPFPRIQKFLTDNCYTEKKASISSDIVPARITSKQFSARWHGTLFWR